MNDMLSFILGAGIGAAGTFLIKNQANGESQVSKNEKEALYTENEKLRQRNKEIERQNEDFSSEIEKLRRKMKSNGENQDDLQDDLEDALRRIKNLTIENAELKRKVDEYQTACTSLENEVNSLKAKK